VTESFWPSGSIVDSLGLSIPIVQAPMAGAGGIPLAKAVQAAGALGSIPAAMLSPDELEAALTSCTDAPLNVNFFTHTPKVATDSSLSRWQDSLSDDYQANDLDPKTKVANVDRAPFNESFCELIERHPPSVVSFHFGLPDKGLVDRVKAAGCQVWSSATTVAEAKWLVDQGANAIIAQGLEAGGHRGLFLDPMTGAEQTTDDVGLIAHQVGTMALIPQIVDVVSVPVIAAGGIADGRTMAAALALGATAVQIGTGFLFSSEATITSMHRSALWSGSAEKTALTNVFSGKPARSVVNKVMQSHGPMSDSVSEFPTAGAALAPLKKLSESKKSADYSSLWSGQSASLTARLVLQKGSAPPSATDLTHWIASDAIRSIKAVTGVS